MDKRAALKAAAAMAAILIISVLFGLAVNGWLWAGVVLVVILVGVFGYGFYDTFKD